jgi:hypothetical protein
MSSNVLRVSTFLSARLQAPNKLKDSRLHGPVFEASFSGAGSARPLVASILGLDRFIRPRDRGGGEGMTALKTGSIYGTDAAIT